MTPVEKFRTWVAHHLIFLAPENWLDPEVGDGLSLSVVDSDGPWEPATSLLDRGPDDRVYVVDRRTGTVSFGDGVHGRRPPPGVTVGATYRQGDGAIGNIAVTLGGSDTAPAPDQVLSILVRGDHSAVVFGACPRR